VKRKVFCKSFLEMEKSFLEKFFRKVLEKRKWNQATSSGGANNNLHVKSQECKRNMKLLRVKYEKNVVSMIALRVKYDNPTCQV
jgi:hypothetical protein